MAARAVTASKRVCVILAISTDGGGETDEEEDHFVLASLGKKSAGHHGADEAAESEYDAEGSIVLLQAIFNRSEGTLLKPKGAMMSATSWLNEVKQP